MYQAIQLANRIVIDRKLEGRIIPGFLLGGNQTETMFYRERFIHLVLVDVDQDKRIRNLEKKSRPE